MAKKQINTLKELQESFSVSKEWADAFKASQELHRKIEHHGLRILPTTGEAYEKSGKGIVITQHKFEFFNHKTERYDGIGIQYEKYAFSPEYNKYLYNGKQNHNISPATRELNELKGQLQREIANRHGINHITAGNITNDDGFPKRLNSNQKTYLPHYDQFVYNTAGERVKHKFSDAELNALTKALQQNAETRAKYPDFPKLTDKQQLDILKISKNKFEWVRDTNVRMDKSNPLLYALEHPRYKMSKTAGRQERWIAQHPTKPTVDVKLNPHLGSRSINDMAAANTKRLAAITTRNRLNLRDTLQATKSNRQNLLIGIGIGALALGGAYAIHRYRSASATKQAPTKQALLSKAEVGKRISEGLKKSNKIKHK